MIWSSLRVRLILLLVGSVLATTLASAWISWTTLREQARQKVDGYLSGIVHEHGLQLEHDCRYLLQLSETFAPTGPIGSMVQRFLYSREPYERYLLARDIPSMIQVATLPNPRIQFATYVTEPDGRDLLARHHLRSDSGEALRRVDGDPGGLRSFLSLGDVRVLAAQRSLVSYSDREVLAVVRPYELGDHRVQLYAEFDFHSPRVQSEGIDVAQGETIYLLLDGELRVAYSSHPDFVAGQRYEALVASDRGQGRYGDYQFFSHHNALGFSTAILLPQAVYASERIAWGRQIGILIALEMLLLVLILYWARRWIDRPVQQLTREIEVTGRGQLDRASRRSPIAEFDRLALALDEMRGEIAALIAEREAASVEREKLALEKLYYQINPHFLMNALNSIHWMAAMHGTDDIDVYVNRLGFVLSYSLGKSPVHATLRTELELLQRYVDMLAMGYDFEFHLEVEDGAWLDQPAARLMLQPLVENAFVHGMEDGGYLFVEVRRLTETAQIEIVIANDNDRIDEQTLRAIQAYLAGEAAGTDLGIGIKFVYSTLQAFYGAEATLEITSDDQRGTRTRVVIPDRSVRDEGTSQ